MVQKIGVSYVNYTTDMLRMQTFFLVMGCEL